jgi:hypothetical protein
VQALQSRSAALRSWLGSSCKFFRVYGERYGTVSPVNVALFGFCKAEGVRRVFILEPSVEPGPLGRTIDAKITEVDCPAPEYVFLMGDHVTEMRARIVEARAARPQGSFERHNAPRDVIRGVIKEGRYTGIGGAVQLAQANMHGFYQYMDLERSQDGGFLTDFRYLGFELGSFGNLGECWFCLPAVMSRA